MQEELNKLIKDEINPQLALHAGSCELLGIDDGVVSLRLFGGCSGCPSSTISLFNGIVPIIKEKFPEVKDIILG